MIYVYLFFLSIFLFFGQANLTDNSSISITGYSRGFDYNHDNWKDTDDIETVIGTTGGVHILAEPGKLIIEIEKRDLNEMGRERELRIVLVGPDHRVITEKRIPDDGRRQGSGMGPPQRVKLETVVPRQGVYSVNITVSGGQRNTDIVWGFRTNSERYLIESARGHRDADHEEPIILRNSKESTDVWFWPPAQEFDIDITDLPDSVRQLYIYDKQGNKVQTLDVKSSEIHNQVVGAGTNDNKPWRLSIPVAQATVQMDGVTRWTNGDPFQNLSYWSDRGSSWFPYHKYRWILTPYNRRVFGKKEEAGEVTFKVFNNTSGESTIELIPEFPGNPFEVEVVPNRLTLSGNESADVAVRYTIPDNKETKVVHLRAKPENDPDFSTYSTLTITAGESPARQPISMPLRLKPYEHENAQLGYIPDYPTDAETYFDHENRPVIRVDGGLMTMGKEGWQKVVFSETVRSSDPHFENVSFDLSRSNTKIAFDQDNDLYHIAVTKDRAALLHSDNYGRAITAYDLGETGGFDIENFTGHNIPKGPPAILRAKLRHKDEDRIWRRIYDLELIVTEKKGDELVINDPVLISDVALGVGTHSGHASAIVSRGDRIHIIWGEATDPEEDLPGVPTYVTTYNRTTGKLEGDPVLIGYGPPANDVHNRPSMTIDSKGYLHALIGTHGQPFLYSQSLEPNDVYSGWTEAEMLADEALRQTYIGLVCGPDDTLHLVYRLWRYSEEPHPKSHHAALAYQRKSPDSTWSEPQMLVVSPFSEYSIFYHRLGIDHKGRLMLSYDYWSTYWFYRNDYRMRAGHYRKTMMSPDNGDTWKLLYTDDL